MFFICSYNLRIPHIVSKRFQIILERFETISHVVEIDFKHLK